MTRPYPVFLIAFSLFLTACSTTKPEPPPPRKPSLANGQSIYKARCASCHDAGTKKAPSIKDPEEWDTQNLKAPGIVKRHRTLPRLAEADEIDVLYYLENELGDSENRY